MTVVGPGPCSCSQAWVSGWLPFRNVYFLLTLKDLRQQGEKAWRGRAHQRNESRLQVNVQPLKMNIIIRKCLCSLKITSSVRFSHFNQYLGQPLLHLNHKLFMYGKRLSINIPSVPPYCHIPSQVPLPQMNIACPSPLFCDAVSCNSKSTDLVGSYPRFDSWLCQ